MRRPDEAHRRNGGEQRPAASGEPPTGRQDRQTHGGVEDGRERTLEVQEGTERGRCTEEAPKKPLPGSEGREERGWEERRSGMHFNTNYEIISVNTWLRKY